MATFSYDDTQAQNDLIDLVEYWADRVTATGQSVGLNRESVYRQLVQAMRNVFQRVPRSALDEAAADGSGQGASNNAGRTEIAIPEDFLVFLNVELGSWKRAVYETIDPRSDEHRLQYNSHTQSDPYNPTVAKVADPSAANGHTLYCYPEGTSPTLDRFAYVPETAPEEVPSTLEDPIVLQATGFVLASSKEQGVETAFSLATQMIRQIERGEAPMVQQAFEEVRQSEEG
jgi:hypothetical protein